MVLDHEFVPSIVPWDHEEKSFFLKQLKIGWPNQILPQAWLSHDPTELPAFLSPLFFFLFSWSGLSKLHEAWLDRILTELELQSK
jgi:hypothetical protein